MSSDSSVSYSFDKVRAVNLGGWLVVEKWIKPELFDGIPNPDFLDGAHLKFKSVTAGKYLCAEKGGGYNIVANSTTASDWETFRIWRMSESEFQLRVAKRQFMGLSKGDGTRIVAVDHEQESADIFTIIQHPGAKPGDLRVRIRASNGFFIQVKTEKIVSADYRGGYGWGDDNPSVFLLDIRPKLHGEYQLTNGLGPQKAPQVMQEHWDTFIVENDFKFMKENGLNAVRIPVGWWIAFDPAPKPYVAGSLPALDDAFLWAKKHGIKVIVDLHAAPGSQNGSEPSSSRDGDEDWEPHDIKQASKKFNSHSIDGFHEWVQNEDNIQETIDVIEFLIKRYYKHPSLLAIELLNEPAISPSVHLEVLIDYYKRCYDIIRKYSKTVYVVMCNRFGSDNQDPTELLSFAEGLSRSVIDVHYYNLFDKKFKDFTVQENINFIKQDRADELKLLTKKTNPLIFVGEWAAVWYLSDTKTEGDNKKFATKEDYRRFAAAQLQVYGKGATFGWSYWTFKCASKHWSLKWNIENGYIQFPPVNTSHFSAKIIAIILVIFFLFFSFLLLS